MTASGPLLEFGSMAVEPFEAETPSELIEGRLRALRDAGDWRGETLTRVRRLIREADPEVVETVKWRKPSNPAGIPVWEHEGLICGGEIYKNYVKLTFAHGAALPDPAGLFNAGFGGNTRRAIDLKEGAEVDEDAFKSLVRAAVELNLKRRAEKSR